MRILFLISLVLIGCSNSEYRENLVTDCNHLANKMGSNFNNRLDEKNICRVYTRSEDRVFWFQPNELPGIIRGLHLAKELIDFPKKKKCLRKCIRNIPEQSCPGDNAFYIQQCKDLCHK